MLDGNTFETSTKKKAIDMTLTYFLPGIQSAVRMSATNRRNRRKCSGTKSDYTKQVINKLEDRRAGLSGRNPLSSPLKGMLYTTILFHTVRSEGAGVGPVKTRGSAGHLQTGIRSDRLYLRDKFQLSV